MIKTKIKIYRKVTLPIRVVRQLENLKITRIKLNKCYHLLFILGINPFRDRFAFYEMQPLSKSYLSQVIGNDYKDVLDILGYLGIIDCDDIHYKGKALCYRINPFFGLEDELKTVTFTYKSKIPLRNHLENKELSENFIEWVKSINIPFLKLYQEVEKIIQNLSLDNYLTGANIPWETTKELLYVDEFGMTKLKRLNKTDALKLAEVEGMELILEKNIVKMMYKDDFLSQKKRFIELSYKNAIESLKDEKTLFAKRNKTNNRLDTNFTSLATPLLDLIYTENNIIEIDQMNSQPALLGYKLDKLGIQGQDVSIFKQISFEGKFYEYFVKEINVPRSLAKTLMFEVLFSSERANSFNKKLFRRSFPTVWNYIKEFKKKNGSKSFSVMLQRLESSIFIDEIYLPLTSQGIVVFTKHDSIACKAADYNFVKKFIEKVYKKLNFQGSLKVKGLDEAA